MKFDDLLAQYLYENKTLQLQEIGTFELDKNVVVPQQTEKDTYHPIEGLKFTYNTKATTTDELVTYLVKRLGKIKPLVSSDLDSYLSNIRQFINIGKPYPIEGIGTLQSDNHNGYEFVPGYFLSASNHERSEHTVLRERPAQELTTTPIITSRPSAGSNKGVVIAVSIVILAAVAWGFYTFVYKPSADTVANNQQPVLVPQVDSIPDTMAISRRPETIANTNPADSGEYKMIFEVTPSRQRAISRTAYLQKLNMPAAIDSSNGAGYRMYIPVKGLASDTTRLRDSLFKVFARKIIIEKS